VFDQVLFLFLASFIRRVFNRPLLRMVFFTRAISHIYFDNLEKRSPTTISYLLTAGIKLQGTALWVALTGFIC
jgi:hypothetical protein